MQKPLHQASGIRLSVLRRAWKVTWISAALGLVHATGLDAQIVNPNFSWNSTVIVPGTTRNFTAPDFTYPDGITRKTNNYVFKGSSDSIWKLNSGATVTCREDYPYIANRFFIGSQDGSAASLTFTTDTRLKPGILCAKGDPTFSLRIGESSSNSKGTLVVDGGVRVQIGQCYGEGPSPTVHIRNGRLDVFTGNAQKRLNGISVILGPEGKLWLEDPTATVKNADAFSSFASGATVSAPGGILVFTNNIDGYPYLGNAGVSGTLVTVDTSIDADADGLPDSWEILYRLDPSDDGSADLQNGPNGDPDNDGSSNLEEFHRNTNPTNRDTDGDDLADGVETKTGIFHNNGDSGTDPLNADSDHDQIPDGTELLKGSDPNDTDDPGCKPDSDDDGLPNVWEIAHRLDPDDNGSIDPNNGPDGDPDEDGLSNSEEFRMDSDPRVNESGYAWQARPKKTGVLVVASHPDDEGIFFGGAIPYYAKVKGIPTVLLSMTSGDYNTAPQVREQQLRGAAWNYGLRCQPIFARFRDYPADANGTWDLWADGVLNGSDVAAGRLKASMYVAKMIRLYRPEIIITHGAGGEYGHNDHVATSRSVVDAWTLAGDREVEIDGLPPWQPQKLYLHEWGQRRLFHDYWESASPSLGGKSPRDAILAGLQFHYNQSKSSTVYEDGEVKPDWDAHPSEWWGLYATTVGNDSLSPDFTVAGVTYSGWAKGDFLEHVYIPDNAPPLIKAATSIDCEYPWDMKIPTTVTDETPTPDLNFNWSMLSGPAPVLFSPTATMNPVASFAKPGRYVLQLSASDGLLGSTREMIVNVLPKPGAIVYAINCGGGDFTPPDGIRWSSDAFYSGGAAVRYPSTPIAGTNADPLFQSQRKGISAYEFPLLDGTYKVTLSFAEPIQSLSGLRRFHIEMEDQRVTTSLDPCDAAGPARAFKKSFGVNVTDGALNLRFLAEIDQPTVAAILITNAEQIPVGPPDYPTELPALSRIDPAIDSDGDGTSDRDEFIAGTSPTVADSNALTLALDPEIPGKRVIGFQTRIADGLDYTGFRRRYRLEQSTTLGHDEWSTIWTELGQDRWQEVSVFEDGASKFYRLATFLEPVP